MQQEMLRSLQLIELKILLEVKRICDKHSIKYFLIGGTLLGAVRHQGFIPWDDDIDIGMFRVDYEIFLSVARNELNSEFFLQTVDSDSGHCLPYGKVRLNKTNYPEAANLHVLENRGIWVDIFPFDNIQKPKERSPVYYVVLSVLDSIIFQKYDYQFKSISTIRKCYNSILKLISYMFPKNVLLNVRNSIMQHYNKYQTEYIINWPYKSAKREYFDELTELPFETVSFPVPKKYHEYLTSFYGDYMRIPPENERPKHSPYEPDFGKYAYIKTLDDVLPKKKE